jgi:hypothetical protein
MVYFFLSSLPGRNWIQPLLSGCHQLLVSWQDPNKEEKGEKYSRHRKLIQPVHQDIRYYLFYYS